MAYKVYTYNTKTGIYTGETYLSSRQVPEGGADNLDDGFTIVDPRPLLNSLGEKQVAFFDKTTRSWIAIEDKYGSKCINVRTFEITVFEGHGPIPEGYSVNIPHSYEMPYLIYDEGADTWVPDNTKHSDLVNAVWDIRKMRRDEECDSDIEYNGHFFHVDSPVSINDLILAGQQAIITNDLDSERTWVTADSTSVTVTGRDIINILRLYGERRERLVMESNAEWERDCNRSMVKLLDYLRDYYESNNSEEID